MQSAFVEKNTFLEMAQPKLFQLRRSCSTSTIESSRAFMSHWFESAPSSEVRSLKSEPSDVKLSESVGSTNIGLCSSSASTSCASSVIADTSDQVSEFNEHLVMEDDQRTTMMVRQIPNRYTRQQLREEIIAAGYDLNFVSLPASSSKGGNRSFAFVNFTTPEEAQRFLHNFQGHVFEQQPGEKRAADVSFAKLQRFIENNTTCAIHGIPKNFSKQDVFELISGYGHDFNFLHLPLRQSTTRNRGFAFVNFVTTQDAQSFMKDFAGHVFKREKKQAKVDWAALQGFEQNVEFFSKPSVDKSLTGAAKPWIKRSTN